MVKCTLSKDQNSEVTFNGIPQIGIKAEEFQRVQDDYSIDLDFSAN